MNSKDKAFCDKVLGLALCNPPMAYNTFDLCERVLKEDIPGDFAEAGVFAGTHPAIMAYVLMKHGVKNRRVHLYDSFEGIPKPQAHEHPHDLEVYGQGTPGQIESSGVSICDVPGVKSYMKMWGVDHRLLIYHKGWFQDTLKEPDCGPLALLRIDCDFYDSTIAVMNGLYPLVIGYVIDDDLGSSTCRQAIIDTLGELPEMTHIDVGTYWWRK